MTEYPNELEMEKKLLSAMMLRDGEAIESVEAILGDGEDFYRPQHRLIYKAMVDLYEQGTPPDILLIESELKRRGEIERVERLYLFSLIDLEYSTARAESYARSIRAKAMQRRLIAAGKEIASEASDERNLLDEVLANAEEKLQSITKSKVNTGFEAVSGVMKRAFDRVVSLRNNPGSVYGVATGLLDVDAATNGFQRSDLILLAARPSMGKTALALNMAAGACKAGKNVAVFSLEMSKAQLGNRLLSLGSGINSANLSSGRLNDAEIRKLLDAYERLSEMKMYIDDTAGLNLPEMRAKARRLKLESGLDLIVLDYLQLMQGGKAENRVQEISAISRGLKALARELDVPILALSQLSRSVELRAEKKPQLSDLRESGSLEQDADIVMFLYRDEYYNRDDSEKENLAELIFAKNRNGPTTSIHLQFEKSTMTFRNLTRVER